MSRHYSGAHFEFPRGSHITHKRRTHDRSEIGRCRRVISAAEKKAREKEQTYLAERELSSFISAVTELYGPEQARLSENDWLEELELMDSPPLSTNRQWRAVTIAASVRLAGRLNTILDDAWGPVASTDTKV
jgi:hypothetical protein